ncbi:MAG: nitrite reductase large subunit, partial [Solirubrobacteraceae bacterium]|nr:nitrite reductase large subunit [Solirubrobacteraceae bacterium]
MSDCVVIVGGGIAGQAVCEALRERDRDVAITLVCGETSAPYDRVRLSEILVSGEDPGTLQLRPAEWYADHDVDLRLGRRVTSVDAAAGRLMLDDATELAFDKLVLATGSQPLMPPINGIDLPGVHPFRGPEDCEAIRAAAAGGAEHAAVIGGGLLGLEAARGIAAQGCAVTVVHLLDRLMERQLDAGAAALLAPALADLDVAIQFERNTTAIIGPVHATGLHFKGGERLHADLVVVSVGIRPEVTLARKMGVNCERGIVVDDAMRTSVPGVLAVGECAQHRGIVYGLVAPIHDQARVAAATLTSDAAAYLGSVPSAKLKVAGIDLVCAGEATGDHEAVVTDGAAGVYRKLATRNGRVVGAILLGDTRGSEALVAAVRAGEPIDDPLQALADASLAGPADLPDTAQICDCNGVCKGDLVAAVADGGCATPREVMAVTRAGTGCGSCRPAVVEIVAVAAGGLSDEPTYLCPCRKQTREQLAGRIRDDGLQSVSEVANACGTGRECGVCKPALAYLVSEVNANRH